MRPSVVLWLLFSLFPFALRAKEITAYTARITEELRVAHPEAVVPFEEANAFRDREDHAQAEERYREVLRLAPEFHHARRRLCNVVAKQGRREEALGLCREALAAAPEAVSRNALIGALLQTGDGKEPNPADLAEARGLARQLVSDEAADPDYLAGACQAAMLQPIDESLFRSCERRLAREAPDSLATQYFAWVAAMLDRRFGDADAALVRARAAGLPEERFVQLAAATASARPAWMRWLGTAAWVCGAWAMGLVLLLVAGVILSRLTLRSAQHLPPDRSGKTQGVDASLRRVYRVVLWSSCLYYYVSLPLVLASVVALGGGIVYGFLAVGRIPIKLVILIVVVVGVTLWAAVKSLFVRGLDADPGDRLDLSHHPRVRAILDEVAARIDTRPVDSVYLTPGTDLAVTERGGMARQLRGTTERCLILGTGVLEGFKLGPFKAVLAHEYGHFSNRDTAGGGFALSVRRSLLVMAHNLAAGGAAAWYNPAWLFLNGFYRIFLRVSQGASRLQEVLADRWAAFAYGGRAFEQGLRHVIERSIRFDAHYQATLKEVIDGGRPLANLYRYAPAKTPAEMEIERAVAQAVAAEPSPYDSHPRPVDRFAWVREIEGTATTDSNNAEETWSLFADREAIERSMTEWIRRAVTENHGVAIAVTEADAGGQPR